MGLVRTTPQGSEYAGGGYSVTVGNDGSIVVKPGDSLSKYSMAIYGDFNSIATKFGRNGGAGVRSFAESGDDINLIIAGETIYQMSRYRTSPGGGGVKVPEDDLVIPVPGAPAIPRATLQQKIIDLIDYLKQISWPFTDWEVTGSDGASLSAGTPVFKFGGELSVFRFWLKRPTDADVTTMYGGSLGASIGLNPDPSPIGGSISLSDFPSVGAILKGQSAGLTLSKDELTGAVLVIELAGNAIVGGSIVIMLGGPGVQEFLTNPGLGLARAILAKWLIISAGVTVAADVELAATVSLGYVQAW